MDWSELHDIYLCREILTVGLMKTKKKDHTTGTAMGANRKKLVCL